MKAWPNFESGNCNKSALGYPKPLKGTLSDQVTEDTTGYLPSSFWRETFEELVVHAGISERKSEDSSSAAAFKPVAPGATTEHSFACREQRDQLLPRAPVILVSQS